MVYPRIWTHAWGIAPIRAAPPHADLRPTPANCLPPSPTLAIRFRARHSLISGVHLQAVPDWALQPNRCQLNAASDPCKSRPVCLFPTHESLAQSLFPRTEERRGRIRGQRLSPCGALLLSMSSIPMRTARTSATCIWVPQPSRPPAKQHPFTAPAPHARQRVHVNQKQVPSRVNMPNKWCVRSFKFPGVSNSITSDIEKIKAAHRIALC
jgi:hypothetical protein